MSNARYIELDSAYRDRTRWPLPAEFEAPISQSGRKDKVNAVDPISDAQPILAWSSNYFVADASGAVLTTTIVAVAAGFGGAGNMTSIIEVTAPAGELQQAEDYYNRATVLNSLVGPPIPTSKVIGYRYLGLTAPGGLDRAELILDPPLSTATALDTLTITDPTDFANTSYPLIFVPEGRSGTNAYANCILYNETVNESRPVSGYSFSTHVLELDTSSGAVAGWSAADNFTLRCPVDPTKPENMTPQQVTTIAAAPAPTINTVTLLAGSSVDNFYTNGFLRIRAATYGNSVTAPENESRRITAYDGTTRVATVFPPFSAAPIVGSDIEILPFSVDNLNPFCYSGSLVSQQQSVCYEVELLNLVLPNVTLNSGQGSRIAFYPYVYVELSNVSSATTAGDEIIYSNNPNAKGMLFRAAIDDVPNPVFSSFVKVDGDGMVQTVKFKPNDTLKFAVRLPNGELFETLQSESYGPNAPNDLIQISVLFSIKRL